MAGDEIERDQANAPIALALLVCDAVHAERSASKPTLLGLFGEVFATAYPAIHPAMSVYAEVTDGRGKIPMRVRLIDADEAGEPITETNVIETDFSDPLMVHGLVFHLIGVSFPEPGEYRLQLFAGTALVLERRVFARQVQGDQGHV